MKKLIATALFLSCFTAVQAQKKKTVKHHKPLVPVAAPVAQKDKEPEEVFMMAEQMPEFNGDIMAFLNRNLYYPENARKKGIQGRVILKFVVDQEGNVTQPIVERGVHADLDAEALRVVKLMPRWKPGRQNGKPVSVYYRTPINFKLQ